MSAPPVLELQSANERLFFLLEEVRRSLAGQREFNVELVRELLSFTRQTDPLIRRHREFSAELPELAAHFEHYFRLISDLRSELNKAEVMLLARRESLNHARDQLHAVARWTTALSSTR
jgi:hypothetical protein